MEINYEVLRKLLEDLLYSDIVTFNCKQDIQKFLESNDMNVFSDESREELLGYYKFTLKDAYEAITGKFLPNVFAKREF